MTYLELENRIKNAKQLDFGNLINDVIELFKKIWLKGFITVLLILASAVMVNAVFILIGFSVQNFSMQSSFDFSNFNDFFEIYFWNVIYAIPQNILISTMTLAFLASFYRMCKQVVLAETEQDDYFYFFKKEYFSKVFMLGIIFTCIAVLAQIMFIIPYLYVFIPLSFFSVVLANNPDLDEIGIVKISFKLGNKKWFITFVTIFVAVILGMLGIIACFIGLLFTLSIVYLPSFFIYKEVVGLHESFEINSKENTNLSDF
jgi:hypothetical protein